MIKTPLIDLNETLNRKLSFNRWEFLYHYSMKALDLDIERFHKLDEKISKFITLVTILISAFAASIPYLLEKCVPPNNPLKFIIIFVSFLSFLFLCSTWRHLFQGLRIQDVPRMPFNDQIIAFFKSDRNENTIFTDLSRTALDAFTKNKNKNSDKVKYLKQAYAHTNIAALFIVIDILLMSIMHLKS